MIYSYLLSSEFWRNIGMLFLCCCMLAPFLHVCVIMVTGIIHNLDCDDGVKKDPAECLFMLGGIAVVCAIVYGIVCAIPELSDENNFFAPKKEVYAKECKKAVTIGVFSKEAPLLYNYYAGLIEFEEEKVRPGISSMEQELKEMTTSAGEKAVLAGIYRAEQVLADVKSEKQKVEAKAAQIYFARYMKNLNINVDDRELRGDLDQICREAEVFMKKYKDNFPADRK